MPNPFITSALVLLLCGATLLTTTHAEEAPKSPGIPAAPTAALKTLPADFSATRQATAVIRGRRVPYRVTTGTLPAWDEQGVAVASLFYVYYERSDVTDKSTRPLMFSFNGGPGSASVWMHLAYTSPKMVRIDAEGYPVQPYGLRDNPESILDATDIVYIDTVNTGYSRIVGDAKRERFFGVKQDIEYLARWLDTFVSRQGRWTSPKYLIGESYGTARVAGLAQRLQDEHWMFLNGVILVSPTSLGIARTGPVAEALSLPYFTATAWFHQRLPADLQARDLEALLPEVEAFTVDELIPALVRGGSLETSERTDLLQRIARYTGLRVDTIRQYGLTVPTRFFWKELLRDQGFTVGRLDSRYRGLDRQIAGEEPQSDAALDAWTHSFAPAINQYLRVDLGVQTDLQYWLFGPVSPWDGANNTTGLDLQQALSTNPYLQLLVQSGYYDGGTPYFDAKYTLWNLDRTGKLARRLSFKAYRSGHMMYLRSEDLAAANDDIRTFLRRSTPQRDAPAKF